MPTTPLRPSHDALGAKFTDFGGWEMPLQYAGVISEHTAVRSGAGVFDVTHLGRFEVVGPGGQDLLRRMLCNDISRIAPGRAQYTMALNESGGVEDDIIVWWIGEERFWVMPNGVNFDDIILRFAGAAPARTVVRPLRGQTVLLAVQGPAAPAIIAEVLGSVPRRFRVDQGDFDDAWFVSAGTGYTGEPGGEICVAATAGPALWEEFVAAGATPCGLGARDTLRLEMGYPLWGQDLTEDTSPLEAGLDWVVSFDHDFVGKAALEDQRSRGLSKRLIGFKLEGRRPPRPQYAMRADGSVGEVTSGNFSPVLGTGIGMGYMSPPPPSDAQLEVSMRDTWTGAVVVEPPFIAR